MDSSHDGSQVRRRRRRSSLERLQLGAAAFVSSEPATGNVSPSCSRTINIDRPSLSVKCHPIMVTPSAHKWPLMVKQPTLLFPRWNCAATAMHALALGCLLCALKLTPFTVSKASLSATRSHSSASSLSGANRPNQDGRTSSMLLQVEQAQVRTLRFVSISLPRICVKSEVLTAGKSSVKKRRGLQGLPSILGRRSATAMQPGGPRMILKRSCFVSYPPRNKHVMLQRESHLLELFHF